MFTPTSRPESRARLRPRASWPLRGGRTGQTGRTGRRADTRLQMRKSAEVLLCSCFIQPLIGPHTLTAPRPRDGSDCREQVLQAPPGLPTAQTVSQIPVSNLGFHRKTGLYLPTGRSSEMCPRVSLILPGSPHPLPHDRDVPVSSFSRAQ